MKRTIKISEFLPSIISTRDSIRSFCELLDIPPSNNIILDFKNIKFISRSATDEFLKLEETKNCKFHIINANNNIISMFRVVKSRERFAEDKFATTTLTTSNEIIEFLSTF